MAKSLQNDLSIVGQSDGTLKHELFHLVVRNNFGDIPPWIDEGMAALYEVSIYKFGFVYGVSNWRGPLLKSLWDIRPSLSELVKMNWDSFDSKTTEYQSVNHAFARYFCLYLQEMGKLTSIYNTFRSRRVENMKEDPGDDSIRLLTSGLKRSLSRIEIEFAQWFEELAVKEFSNRSYNSRENIRNIRER